MQTYIAVHSHSPETLLPEKWQPQ